MATQKLAPRAASPFAALLAAHRAGSDGARDAFFAHIHELARSHLRWTFTNVDAAMLDDATQVAVLKLLTVALPAAPAAAKAYVRVVARHALIDELRIESGRDRRDFAPAVVTDADEGDRDWLQALGDARRWGDSPEQIAEAQQVVDAVLDALTPAERVLLALLAAGHKPAEIALRLGKTEGAVNTAASRLRAKAALHV